MNKPDLVVSKIAWGIGWTFIRAPKSLKNCTLMGSFCPKHSFRQKISEELCIITLKGVAKFKGKLTCGSKNDIRSLVSFHASSRESENLNFDRTLFPKHTKIKMNKYRKVISHDTEEWCKVSRITDFWVQKCHEEFGEFSWEQWEVWKFGLWCATFVNSM